MDTARERLRYFGVIDKGIHTLGRLDYLDHPSLPYRIESGVGLVSCTRCRIRHWST